MNFALFVLLNAVLLIRPEELIPDIAGLRLYLMVIAGCILTTGSRILEILQPQELVARPITVCVIGLLFAGILSQLMRGQIGLAIDFAGDFSKVILYYLLLISVIDTPERLRSLLGWLVVFVVIISTLGLLQYHGAVDLEALQPLERKTHSFAEEEDPDFIHQLRGTGIYNDPNDLCLILVTASLAAGACSATAVDMLGRIFWLLPIGLFVYAVTLTQSRGGLLGLLVAGMVCTYSYLGWKKTLLLGIPAIPVMMLLAGGRQADMNLGKEDTAHQRVELWAEGFNAMKQNPITGIGVGEYADQMGLVAHNSFVHAYVEIGLLGGSLFFIAFAVGAFGVFQMHTIEPSRLTQLRPFILAIIVGYAGGIFSISRDYVVPTFMALGLTESYLRMVDPTPEWFQMNRRMIIGMMLIGVVGLLGLYAFTRVMLSAR